MPEQKITTDVATRETGPTAIVLNNRDSLAEVMPSHVNAKAWCRLAVGALKRDPKLMEAAQNDTTAFWSAIMDAAQQGLTPGTDEYYLVPRRRKRGEQPTIMGVTGYQGYIELMYRAGAVSSVTVEVVRERDLFTYTPGRDQRPVHEIDWDAEERGNLRLVYAFAEMRDGATSRVVVLNKAQIERIKAKSDSANSRDYAQYSPWNTNPEAMWMKSAVRQLRKWVPTSAEYIRERLRAVQEVAGEGEAAAQPLPRAHPQPDASSVEADAEVADAEIVNEAPGGGSR
jgi:recombination protein RecT